MSETPPIDAALEGLSELAGCDLRLAKRFAARIEALPEDEDAKAMDLARSYQRMARSYRQTIVVQARLRRELEADARRRDVWDRPEPPRRETTLSHMARLETAATARIRYEYDPSEAERLEEELPDLVTDLWDDDFADLDEADQLEAVMAGLRQVATPAASPSDDPETPPIGHSPVASGRLPPQAGEAELFNGRLAPPMDLPSWLCDDDSS